MKAKILIGPSSFAESNSAPLERLKAAGFTVIDNPYKRKMTKQEIISLLADDVAGILAGLEPLDREVLTQSSLKCISRVGAGMTNVDLKAAAELDIPVFNTPDGPTNAVAELVVGALISMLRYIPQSNKVLHEKEWTRKIGAQIEGKTIAIIGFGHIGRRVAELLAPFKAKLIAVDPFLDKSQYLSCPLMTLEEALPQADIITIHTSGDECMFDYEAFNKTKKGVFILNAARGNIISEEALIKALDDGIVEGAWLDTYSIEPYNGRLCNYNNVVLTPHIGSYTMECRQYMESKAVNNLLQELQK